MRAAVAKTKEFDLMPQSGVGGPVIDPGVQVGIDGKVEIDNGTAAITDKMVMGRSIRFKTVEGASKVDLFNKALIQKDVQVSVDRTYTEIWKLILQLGVEPVGGGMVTGLSQQLKYSITLSATIIPAVFCYALLLN